MDFFLFSFFPSSDKIVMQWEKPFTQLLWLTTHGNRWSISLFIFSFVLSLFPSRSFLFTRFLFFQSLGYCLIRFTHPTSNTCSLSCFVISCGFSLSLSCNLTLCTQVLYLGEHCKVTLSALEAADCFEKEREKKKIPQPVIKWCRLYSLSSQHSSPDKKDTNDE